MAWVATLLKNKDEKKNHENINECNLCIGTIGNFWSWNILFPGLFDKNHSNFTYVGCESWKTSINRFFLNVLCLNLYGNYTN